MPAHAVASKTLVLFIFVLLKTKRSKILVRYLYIYIVIHLLIILRQYILEREMKLEINKIHEGNFQTDWPSFPHALHGFFHLHNYINSSGG